MVACGERFLLFLSMVLLGTGFVCTNKVVMAIALIGVVGSLGILIFAASKRQSIFNNLLFEVTKFSESLGQTVEPYGFKVTPGGNMTSGPLPDMTPGRPKRREVVSGLNFWLDIGVRMSRSNDIAKLPTMSYHVADHTEEDQPMCAICMSDFEEHDHLRELPCGHRYHVLCIDKWLQNHDECPMCKQDFRCGPAKMPIVQGHPLLMECTPPSVVADVV